MATHTTEWSDDENQRLIAFDVEYSVEGETIRIESLAATSVRFLDVATGQVLRALGVYTETGRQLLARLYEQHVGLDRVQNEIAEKLVVEAS